MLLHKQKTHSKSYKKQKFNTRSRFTKVQEASESIFTLFFSSFMLFHSSLFFKFWVSYPDTRRLNKVEVGNLKFYYFCCAQVLLQLWKYASSWTLCVAIMCIFPTNHYFYRSKIFFFVCLAIIFTYQLTLNYSWQSRLNFWW